MYSDVITLFNHYKSRLGDMWYPTVIRGVNLNMDEAAIAQKNNFKSNDKALLNIHYQTVGGRIMVDGKPYLPPEKWSNQTNDKLPETITFSSGNDFDFFMLGEYTTIEPIADDDYIDGFYNHVNDNYDFVFAVTSVGYYSVIPHFEIMGA